MKSYEHRAIGDAATGDALVNVGGDSESERFLLSFGDVVALSGDYFPPSGTLHRAAGSGDLFDLARVPGDGGTRVGTRDEIICALMVSTVDEDVVDPRFDRDGQFAAFRHNRRASRADLERRVRDRYLLLAATNDDHFVAPGPSTAVTGSGYASARAAYRNLHQIALDEAWRLGRQGGDIALAMAREAAAQHYLTDAFASGHLRTPVAAIRSYWKARYPAFWGNLQRRVASGTASALRHVSWLLRTLPDGFVERRAVSEVRARTSTYPELSLGDLVARCFHDWDNDHGLRVDGGGFLFGDGRVDEGVTKPLALAAVRAGADDLEIAYSLGRSGHWLRGPALYEAVRDTAGAGGEAFVAETLVPRVSSDNSAQNWQAPDVDTLWESPMVGGTGPTVGEALLDMLAPGGEFLRQVESLGQGLSGNQGVFAVPVLGRWLTNKCCQAYHEGFVETLADDPASVLFSLVDEPAAPAACGAHAS